jgi:hypothetical protein
MGLNKHKLMFIPVRRHYHRGRRLSDMLRCNDGYGHRYLYTYVLSRLYRQVHTYLSYLVGISSLISVDVLNNAPPTQAAPDAPAPKTDERPCELASPILSCDSSIVPDDLSL